MLKPVINDNGSRASRSCADRLGCAHPRHSRSKDQIPQVEQQISSESDAGRRRSLENLLVAVKIAAGKPVDSELLARESELSSALQYERSVAQEVTDKITPLERLLDSEPPAK